LAVFEEALADNFFRKPPKAFAVDDLVSLTVVVRKVIFCSKKCKGHVGSVLGS